jgi:hypothetical protein
LAAPKATFFGACYYFVGCSIYRTLLQTAICYSPNYLNGPDNLFDQFSVVLSFIALISGCFQAPIWVAQPLFLLLFYFLVQITRWFHDFINECSPIISNKRHYKDKEPIG